MSKQTHTFGNTSDKFEYNYGYDEHPDDRVASIGLNGKFVQNIEYSPLGKTSQLKLSSTGNFNITEKYTYLFRYRSVDETPYVGYVDYCIGNKTETDNYDYDANGNISEIQTARGNIQYDYDGLNRVTQEINHITNKKYNYTYDAGGNILTKKITNLYNQQVEKQYTYTYDRMFKDRLVSFGNEIISGYDLQGRPIDYRGWNLRWKNGRVSAFTKNGLTHSCEYDANGIRIKKVANGLTHEYYLSFVGSGGIQCFIYLYNFSRGNCIYYNDYKTKKGV